MSAPAKFLFDADFGAARGRPPDARSTPTFAAALAEAEARGYRIGHATGRAESGAESERRLAFAFERAADALEKLAQGLRTVESRLEAEAVEVATAVASKLAPALIAREPFAEIAALASECFAHLVGAPHVVVRVSEDLHTQAAARLTEIARTCGFEGRLVVLAEPDIAPGDCRIEWADGGLCRHRARTEAVITEAVERYIRSAPAAGRRETGDFDE
jgi:flagellar assembly protein FliH